jgi:hypothetical protein
MCLCVFVVCVDVSVCPFVRDCVQMCLCVCVSVCERLYADVSVCLCVCL